MAKKKPNKGIKQVLLPQGREKDSDRQLASLSDQSGASRRKKKKKRKALEPCEAPSAINSSAHVANVVETEMETGLLRYKKTTKKRKRKALCVNDDAVVSEPKVPKREEESNDTVIAVDAFRKKHEIDVKSSCPDPFQSFKAAEVQLTPALTKELLAHGFQAPTPIQAQAWPIALQGDDLIGVAKTGSGKTCAFLIPALVRLFQLQLAPANAATATRTARPSVLVIAPTRELSQQIASEAEQYASVIEARVVCLVGGVPKDEQVAALRIGAEIIIATPGRLLDLAKRISGRDPAITLESVIYLVLDEADRMLDMGFGPDIRKVVDGCRRTGTREEVLSGSARQTLFFTATWPAVVRRAAESLTNSRPVQVKIGQSSLGSSMTANADVKQTVIVLQEREKMYKLKDVIATDMKGNECAIVFATRKGTCDELQLLLLGSTVPSKRGGQDVPLVSWCRALHGDKEQWEREQTLNAFRAMACPDAKQLGRKAVLLATDVASRGLDIPGVALVIIYDFGGEADRPGTESYVHRIGRTGRAGKLGRSVTFFTPEDGGAAAFIDVLRGAGQEVPMELEALAARPTRRNEEKQKKKGTFGKGGKGKGGKGKSGKGKGKRK